MLLLTCWTNNRHSSHHQHARLGHTSPMTNGSVAIKAGETFSFICPTVCLCVFYFCICCCFFNLLARLYQMWMDEILMQSKRWVTWMATKMDKLTDLSAVRLFDNHVAVNFGEHIKYLHASLLLLHHHQQHQQLSTCARSPMTKQKLNFAFYNTTNFFHHLLQLLLLLVQVLPASQHIKLYLLFKSNK